MPPILTASPTPTPTSIGQIQIRLSDLPDGLIRNTLAEKYGSFEETIDELGNEITLDTLLEEFLEWNGIIGYNLIILQMLTEVGEAHAHYSIEQETQS